MTKIIRTVIDERGNVTTDLSGFAGDECVTEEERFRHNMAQYGLVLHTQHLKRKRAASDITNTIRGKIS